MRLTEDFTLGALIDGLTSTLVFPLSGTFMGNLALVAVIVLMVLSVCGIAHFTQYENED